MFRATLAGSVIVLGQELIEQSGGLFVISPGLLSMPLFERTSKGV